MTVMAALAVMASMFGCSPSADTDEQVSNREGELTVFVSIPPQKFFVERIGGPHVRVQVLIPPGQSPATYEPTSKQIVALADADVYFRIGVPFERQVVGKIEGALEGLPIVNMAREVQSRRQEAHVHDEEDGHHHDHEAEDTLDPHVWMSPRAAAMLARCAADELKRLDAAHAATFDANLAALLADLTKADHRIAASLADLQGREFFVFHPAYGYFADAYGLTQTAIESSGKAPTTKQLGQVIARARAAKARLILVQPQFDRSNAALIAREIGGSVVAIDPLAEDYLANLERLAEAIRTALGAGDLSTNGSEGPSQEVEGN